MPASAEAAPEAAATCPLCGYDLRGQRDRPEPRCPECGRRFDWADFADPARRRHPSLFEHHPERPVGSYFRTLIGGLRPARFWRSINPAGPSKPRRFMAYWLVGAVVWTAMMIGVPVVTAYADYYYRMSSSSGGFPADVVGPTLRQIAWERALNPSVWRFFKGRFPYYYTADDPFLLERVAFPWLIGLAWPWLSAAAILALRASRRQARIAPRAVLRTAAYGGDLLVWMAAAFAVTFALLICARNYGRAGFGWWLPGSAGVAAHLPAALGVCWLLFAYRLYAAHRYYLRLPHAAGVVIATQVVLLLILANLYVLTLI